MAASRGCCECDCLLGRLETLIVVFGEPQLTLGEGIDGDCYQLLDEWREMLCCEESASSNAVNASRGWLMCNITSSFLWTSDPPEDPLVA